MPVTEDTTRSLFLSHTRVCTIQRLKMLVKREGRILSSKDFPHDPVDYHEYDTFVQVLRPSPPVALLPLLILYCTRCG